MVHAGVPLSEIFSYATELHSISVGKATYTIEFEKWANAPSFIQGKVMKKCAEKAKEDAALALLNFLRPCLRGHFSPSFTSIL